MKMKSLNFFIIFLLTASCADKEIYYNQREESIMTQIERVDHQYCTQLGLDSGDDNPIKAEIYWRCRIIIAQKRIIPETLGINPVRSYIIKRQFINRLKTSFAESFEKSNDQRNSLFDNNDHLKCINLGHNLDTLDKSVIEDYYSCRKKLINEQQLIPPFFNEEYFHRGQDTYNIPFSINKNIDYNIAQHEEQKKKYPFCVKYFEEKSEEYPKCVKDFENQKTCYKKIKKSEIAKKMEELSICQKKSYQRFPESMLKEDKERDEEIDNTKVRADIDYSNNLASLGITQDKMESFKPKTDEEKLQEKKENQKKNFNTKNELYNKIELSRLRQEFLALCNQESKPKISDYVDVLTRDCKAITLQWEENSKNNE